MHNRDVLCNSAMTHTYIDAFGGRGLASRDIAHPISDATPQSIVCIVFLIIFQTIECYWLIIINK